MSANPSQSNQSMAIALYQRGCKITAGARPGPPPPSYRQAKLLVLAKRASSRIIKPAAALAIQKAYKRTREERRFKAVIVIAAAWIAHKHHAHQVSMAIRLQAARRRMNANKLCRELVAAIKIQGATRRHHAQMLRLGLVATRIQAYARVMLALRHYRESLEAIRLIQATWQMVRSQVVGRRLAGAVARLQSGAELSKYQKGGLSHERHERFVWLSKDRKKLCWGEATTAPPEARCSESAKGLEMDTITAVTAGIKTSLMKKMERRGTTKPALISGRARPLDATCAFSLISRDRVLDLVAPDEMTGASWLRDLRTLLLYAHHLDHKAAVGALEAGLRRGSLVEPPQPATVAAAA